MTTLQALTEELVAEFDKEFSDNEVWWQECIAEMRVGDPDFNRLRNFIKQALHKVALATIEAVRVEERDLAVCLCELFGNGGCGCDIRTWNASRQASIEKGEEFIGISKEV